MILDSDGKVRATTDPGCSTWCWTTRPVKRSARGRPEQRQIWHDGMVDSIASITSGDKRIGYARVILNGAAVQGELAAVTRDGIEYAAVRDRCSAASCPGWLVRTMTRRLDRLSAAADAIAAGNLDIALADDTGRDEVARLARDFSQMARALRQQHEQRSRYEASLFTEKERAQVTLASIGDGVITTDIARAVSNFSTRLQRSSPAGTLKKPAAYRLTEVFHIINERHRARPSKTR